MSLTPLNRSFLAAYGAGDVAHGSVLVLEGIVPFLCVALVGISSCKEEPPDTGTDDDHGCGEVFLCEDDLEVVSEAQRALSGAIPVNGSIYSITVGDLAGTGSPQVLLGTTYTATRLDGEGFATATELWTQPGDGRAVYPEIGDITGDGVPDLVLGLPGSDDGAGQVVVFPGPVVDPVSWGTSNIQIKGDDHAGQEPKVADLNGDGLPDLVTWSEEMVWVRFGPVLETERLGLPEDAFWTKSEGVELVAVDAPGDLTGDGVQDLAIVLGEDPEDVCAGVLYQLRIVPGPLSAGGLELQDPVLEFESLDLYPELMAPALGDWNDDGVVDAAFVSINREFPNLVWFQIQVHMGPLYGSEPFARFGAYGLPVGLADFDSDGMLDLFQTYLTGIVSGPLDEQPLGYGEDCTLELAEDWTGGHFDSEVGWIGDIDEDGEPDVVMGGNESGPAAMVVLSSQH